MIEAIRSDKGQPRARVQCDDCGRDDVVPCNHERARGGEEIRVNQGQVVKKVSSAGWALVKGTLRCPSCEAKRKAASATVRPKSQKENAMPVITTPPAEGLRRPTPAQKRQIIGLLEDSYDDDAKRYRNAADTDKTLAEVIGGGCMWGWVAEIREELFGPDTRNAEIEALRAEVKRIDMAIEEMLSPFRDALSRLHSEKEAIKSQQATLKARLDKVL